MSEAWKYFMPIRNKERIIIKDECNHCAVLIKYNAMKIGTYAMNKHLIICIKHPNNIASN